MVGGVAGVNVINSITGALPAGGNAIGDVAITARATGGVTPFHLISAATTNATSVKAAPGRLHIVTAHNINASPRYLKLYDKATAPVVGTDIPKYTFLIPGGTVGTGFTLESTIGTSFLNGIALAITGGITDADATAILVNEVAVNLGYV